MERIILRTIPLPAAVEGVTVKDENDDYNVYLNARLGEGARRRVLAHELRHIRHGHFFADAPVEEDERDAGR